MIYKKHEWEENEYITSEKLNYIEEGISNLDRNYLDIPAYNKTLNKFYYQINSNNNEQKIAYDLNNTNFLSFTNFFNKQYSNEIDENDYVLSAKLVFELFKNNFNSEEEFEVLIEKIITQNGTYDPANDSADGYNSVIVNVNNSYSILDEGKVVSSGALVSQTSLSIDTNGTYDTTTNNSVSVNVSGSGGDIIIPPRVVKFVNNYSSDRVFAVNLNSMGEMSGGKAEYSDYIYGKTAMISDLGLVLLGNFSQGGGTTGNTLTNSIANYSAVVLQGIYSKTTNSQYNTSMMYYSPELNTAYWAGMKDRNNNYTCNVTFTDNTHCNLSGNKQVIIYGLP